MTLGHQPTMHKGQLPAKVRLALALLIKMVAMVVEVLWWNLDS